MSRRMWIGFSVLLLALGGFACQGGQGLQAAGTLYVVEQEDIDPALTGQYEKGVQLAIASMQKAKLGPELNWSASQYQSSYFYIFQVGSLAEIDLTSPQMRDRNAQLATAMDEATYGKFASLTTPAIRGNHLSVLEPLPEFSYQPANNVVKDPKYNYVEILRVQAGHVERFQEVTAEIIGAVKQSGYPMGFTAYRTVIGDGKVFFDHGRTYYFIAPYDSRSQFYEEHPFGAALEKAVGKARGNQLYADQLKCLVTMESYDYRLRPDMGYQAAK